MRKTGKVSKSSRQWLKEHFTDNYVKSAHKLGYRSRAFFKLEEIHQKYNLFGPGMVVIDLGAAPGGWSQLVAKLVKSEGRVIAVDLLPMGALAGVCFIRGDFTEMSVSNKIIDSLAGQKVDWIISDMAPNISGNSSIDNPATFLLVKQVVQFVHRIIPRSGLLVKVFQGEGLDDFMRELCQVFESVTIYKPKASRGRSREIYLLARGAKIL